MIIFAFEQNMTYMTQLRMDFEETANSEQYDEWDDIDIDRVNYSHDMKVLNRYPRDKSDKTFVVPDGVVTIAEEAFMGCKHLNKIVLPESLRQIDAFAFKDCILRQIDAFAFKDCIYLEEVHFPKGLHTIQDYAFEHCSSLTSVRLSEGLYEIGEEAFRGCSALAEIHLPDSLELLGKKAFYRTAFYNNPQNWTDSMLYLGKCLLANEDKFIVSVDLPSDLRIIGDNMFDESVLSSIILPETLVTISNDAFSGCDNL